MIKITRKSTCKSIFNDGKKLLQQISKHGNPLTRTELQELEVLTTKFGGRLRFDLKAVKGKIKEPHVQIEGLGGKIKRRHIWIEP